LRDELAALVAERQRELRPADVDAEPERNEFPLYTAELSDADASIS